MKISNTRISFFLSLFVSILSVFSCAPDFDDFDENSSGQSQVDFSKYIAVGNSLTAGFADGGLYLEGQQAAFPNIIAAQLKSVGGGEFMSPFFDDAHANGSGYVRLKDLVNGNPITENVTDKLAIRGMSPTQRPLYTKYTNEIQNLGIPGMRLDMAFVAGVGSVYGNPYFERLLTDDKTQTETYFNFATTKEHTFFSFWLGNNDVLGYATNGAYHDPNDPTTALTETGLFANLYTNFIEALTAGERKGVVATIPDVTVVPYFNTVTTARLEAGVQAKTEGQYSKVYITTSNGVRMATDEDLFPLTFPTDTLGKAVIFGNPATAGYGLIEQNPLHDKFVLDRDEVMEITTHIETLNSTIKSVAESKELALADAHDYLHLVKNGLTLSGIDINASYITGNVFSLDGIHLTPMGNAIMANLFIDAINLKYSTDIPRVDITKYRAVILP